MASVEEKFDLVLEASRLCLKQEFRGGLLQEHMPDVSIVVAKDPEDKGGAACTTTEIRVVYPNGKVGETANWGGMGRSVDDSLTANLWCLQYEIEDRLRAYQEMLDRLRAAAPINNHT